MGKRMERASDLSKEYHVRKMSEEDVDIIYQLSMGNPMFYRYCPPWVTKESILDDLRALPPRITYEDKHYAGYFQDGRLVAVMDLILGYPNEETAFIGLFMMDKDSQGKGLGSGIVEECFHLLRTLDYRFVRLGFAKGNPRSGEDALSEIAKRADKGVHGCGGGLPGQAIYYRNSDGNRDFHLRPPF